MIEEDSDITALSTGIVNGEVHLIVG